MYYLITAMKNGEIRKLKAFTPLAAFKIQDEYLQLGWLVSLKKQED